MHSTSSDRDHPAHPIYHPAQKLKAFITTAQLGSDPLFGQQWYLQNTGQSGGTPGVDLNIVKVWQDYRGRGIKVGILDDGVQYTHPDLQPNFNTNIDFDAAPTGNPKIIPNICARLVIASRSAREPHVY
ncbi:S8 family serine peptidase [Leptolyngbya sp. 7M]|uniref:S8 family serine peptidase n=1 Tax=Leptolyngbya sp. 7M TaxID=2812896 RepID=UPI001B8C230D|nr:S8 family serine peptidase [Leptolyngbya sp. 7M]QYO62559.1 S8 family serine peptidase [Leptolyngbya sp. 7M]